MEPLYLFVSANKYVGLCTNTLEMSPRLCSIFNLVAVFGAITGLEHARVQHWVHPPPCANYQCGIGRSPLFRAQGRVELCKLLVYAVKELRSVLGFQPSVCMHKVFVLPNGFTL